MEFRHIGPDRDFNSNPGRSFFLRVILGQPFPDFTGRNSHNCVIACKVGRRAVEEFHPNRAFLQRLGLPQEGMLDYIREKSLRAVALAKGVAFSDPIQLAQNQGPPVLVCKARQILSGRRSPVVHLRTPNRPRKTQLL
jgi:hypothetical protein